MRMRAHPRLRPRARTRARSPARSLARIRSRTCITQVLARAQQHVQAPRHTRRVVQYSTRLANGTTGPKDRPLPHS